MKLILVLSLPLFLGSRLVGGESVPDNPFAIPPTTPAQGEPLLYARDGRPVSGTPIEVQPAGATRGVEGEEGSRLYLLELYSQTVDERDELLAELDTLHALLAEARRSEQTFDARLQQTTTRAEALEARSTQLESTNKDLAARLATAQIRRLEAEKELLELKLSLEPVGVPPEVDADGEPR